MKMHKKRIDRTVDVDAISDDDVLDTTTPRHDNQGPEQKFFHKLEAAKELRQKFSGLNKTPEEIATLIDVEPSQENLDMIHDLMKSKMWTPTFESTHGKFSLGESVEAKIRLVVTEAVAEFLDERWREDDEAEWHQSINGATKPPAQQPASGAKIVGTTSAPGAGAASGAAVQKARQLVAMATQMAARKNPVMGRHVSTLATQFEDLIKQPSEANNLKALRLASQISSLAKSIS